MHSTYFEKYQFISVFNGIIKPDGISKAMRLCSNHTFADRFLLTNKKRNFYIIHLDSGLVIGWTGSFGNRNHCNNPKFSEDDLDTLALMLSVDISEIEEKKRCYRPIEGV